MSNIKTGNYAKTDVRMLVVIHAEAAVINEGQFGDVGKSTQVYDGGKLTMKMIMTMVAGAKKIC